MTFYTTLARLISEAEQELTRQTGGENVCRLEKDGRITGGVKYSEGRLAALNAVRRLLQPDSEAAADAEIDRLLVRWRADLQGWQERPQPPRTWVAYTQGGVDALEQLLALTYEHS